MNIPKKLISLLVVLFCFSLAIFAIETQVFEEKTDKYSVKIQYVEEMAQAKFIITIPQALFERSKAFNLMNDKIRKFQTEQYFSSYARIRDDQVRYNNSQKQVVYVADVQFKNKVSGVIEHDDFY